MQHWYNDKANVKDIFDSIRNYALCGLVFYSGVYSLVQMPTEGWFAYSSLLNGVIFIVLSVYLAYVNTRSIWQQMGNWTHGRIASFFLSISLLSLSIFLLTHTAMNIDLKNGETIGTTKLRISVSVGNESDGKATKSSQEVN